MLRSKLINNKIKFYEKIGIRYFQKLVFALEKIIHIKDKKQNINYHFNAVSSHCDEDFIKYLRYNATIHIKNFLLIILLILFCNLLYKKSFIIFILCILAIKDIYCIMLQRYNYLRIKLFMLKKEQKREQELESKINKQISLLEKVYEKENKESDIKLLSKIIQNANTKNLLIFTNDEEKALFRLILQMRGEDG